MVKFNTVGRAKPILGVVRLDDYEVTWDASKYKPAPGDVDHPISFNYPVKYAVTSDCTFDNLCNPSKFLQDSQLHNKMKKGLDEAIIVLKAAGCNVITSDCGLFMWLQDYASSYTELPVCLSSLVILPDIFEKLSKDDKVGIFTSNGESLNNLRKEVLRKKLGNNVERLVVIGCNEAPYGVHIDGFEAVSYGKTVDVEKVKPGMIAVAQSLIRNEPKVKAIVVECTEIPPYSDAIRQTTKLPVYDPINICDSFINSFPKQADLPNGVTKQCFADRYGKCLYEVLGETKVYIGVPSISI